MQVIYDGFSTKRLQSKISETVLTRKFLAAHHIRSRAVNYRLSLSIMIRP